MAKKIRVLVIGVGNMGSSHARAYQKLAGFELVGLVDQNRHRLDKLSTEFGGIESLFTIENLQSSQIESGLLVSFTPQILQIIFK